MYTHTWVHKYPNSGIWNWERKTKKDGLSRCDWILWHVNSDLGPLSSMLWRLANQERERSRCTGKSKYKGPRSLPGFHKVLQSWIPVLPGAQECYLWGHPPPTPCPFSLSFFFFALNICLMWTIFKVVIQFATILLLLYVLVFWPQGMWNLSSPTTSPT